MIGAGVGGLAVLAAFAAWERVSSHPMLNRGFFRRRRFSAAIGAATFGLFGALFVLTQFLQLVLGYSALEAGLLIVARGLTQLSTASATAFTGILPGLILL